MNNLNNNNLKRYTDNFSHYHNTTDEISRGGQGVVYHTTDPNIAIKLELKNGEIINDDSNNKKFLALRKLPIPYGLHITLPVSILQGVAGYSMMLLDEMTSFQKAFTDFQQKDNFYRNDWLEEILKGNKESINLVKEFSDYIVSGGVRRRLQAYLETVCIMSVLHSNGLVYCDFSPNNVFISNNIDNPNVWLIDADNLNFQDETKKNGYYTPSYNAPEVPRGEGCTFYSDNYSLAISLFKQLTNRHPFDGSIFLGDSKDYEDYDYEDLLEFANNGELPWIADTEDDSNHLDDDYMMKIIMNSSLLSLFDRTFCYKGRTKRSTRPTSFEWSYGISKCLDTTLRCPVCKMDYNAISMEDETYRNCCPWCDEPTKTLNITSYYCINGEKTHQIWKYIHELTNIPIHIPIRVAHGFETKNINQYLFDISFENGTIKISNLDYGLTFQVYQNDTLKTIYGSFKINQNSLDILCSGNNLKCQSIIEVRVNNGT